MTPSLPRLAGKTALVTGASRGIGLAIARSLAAEGAGLALCAVDKMRLQAVAEGLRRDHPGLVVFSEQCDVSDFAATARFVAEAERLVGPVDVLINNAGVVVRRELAQMSEAEWDLQADVNLKGVFNLCRHVAPGMIGRRTGRIINLSSISGTLGTPTLTAYCAAKHGVIGLTRALAEELRESCVQVNAVCPGSVDTDMLKGSGFAPAMKAEDVARVVTWLATDAPIAQTGSAVEIFG